MADEANRVGYNLTILDDYTHKTKPLVKCFRNGRSTIAEATLNLSLHDEVVMFSGHGCAMRDPFDKDCPEIGAALATSRALRALATQVEDYYMDAVRQRCTGRNPFRGMATDTIRGYVDRAETELWSRRIVAEKAAATREKCLAEAAKLTPAIIKERREARRAARRTKGAAASKKCACN
jgi:hypothetical protein